MGVYVDPLKRCVPNKNWRWTSSCHLFADSLTELHEFAALIGMQRVWFQDHGTLPHYDLTERRRRLAVRYGALELSTSEAVSKWKEIRENDKNQGKKS